MIAISWRLLEVNAPVLKSIDQKIQRSGNLQRSASAMIQFFVVRTGRPGYKEGQFQVGQTRPRCPPIWRLGPCCGVDKTGGAHPKKRELRRVSVRGRLVYSVLALVWCVARSATAHGASAATGEVDVRAEIAAALFAASATQAAAERVADVKIRSQRKQIEELRAKVRAGDAKRKTELTAAEEKVTRSRPWRSVMSLCPRDRRV